MAAATTIKLIAASLFGHQMARDYNENHDHLASKKKKKTRLLSQNRRLEGDIYGWWGKEGGGAEVERWLYGKIPAPSLSRIAKGCYPRRGYITPSG